MEKITESKIETFAIELLEEQGYQYIYGPQMAADGEFPERGSYSVVLLIERLKAAINRVNPTLPQDVREEALKQVIAIDSAELLHNNEIFHTYLSQGINVSHNVDGHMRGDTVWLIDYQDISKNEFVVVNQFTVVEGEHQKRPDIILFVNGLPLVVLELKNPTDERATVRSAFKQLQTYKAVIPSLFNYNGLCIVSDGLEAKMGSLSAGYSRFLAWKTADGEKEASHLVSQMETLIKGMLNKETLLDLIKNFTVFEKMKSEDLDTGLTIIETVKKIAAYHQYYAVNKAIKNTQKATSVSGDKKGGVVWHTQGSGKSLSMVFYSGKIVQLLDNPTLLVITDRNDLDDQLFDTFAASKQLLRQVPVQAKNRDHLRKLLKVNAGGIVFTTIQKFQPEEGNVYEELSDRRNIIVIADEAHRTQYGFKAKTKDVLNKDGHKVGVRTVFGFAKYMRDALPGATYLGFTGTPIEGSDVNTPAVFGNYIDIYDIGQAVDDGATVKIFYESRLVKIELNEDGKKLIEELDEELKYDELDENQKAKAKWTKLEALVGSERRISNLAQDIVQHYESRQEVFEGKGMIVTMSRRIAVDLYDKIINLRPNWEHEDLRKGVIKIVMSASSSEGPKLTKHHLTKKQKRSLADRMRNPKDELQLVIVVDMWLTGFDAPCLHTMYIDKPLKGHNLMQAIARVNRVYKDKPGGLIVDYLGIASDLKKALSFYSESGGKGDPTEGQEKAVDIVLEKIEIISQLFLEKPEDGYSDEYVMVANDPEVPYIGKDKGLLYEEYFTASIKQKLQIILAAEEHILGLDKGKERFVKEATLLSQAFAIAVPHVEAMDVKEEVSFFQAVKARLVKFDMTGSSKTDEEIETAIRQVVDKAILSDKVIDIFDAAGIKKPELSILDEDFLMEIKGMKHQNLALETLKKLLNDEIKVRSKTNLIQSRSLMEMLQNAIKKYQNKILTAAEVIQELIEVAEEIKNADKRGKASGMSTYELAFYDAVANNKSAKEMMKDETLREIARILVEKVKSNASIDWTIKDDVKAKIRVIVKRTLRKYGYPPDMQKFATDTVLQQAELLADLWKEE